MIADLALWALIASLVLAVVAISLVFMMED